MVHREHLVRVGVLGHVGRFRSVGAMNCPRGTRVVCRTRRGLEVGEVLVASSRTDYGEIPDGEILRGVTSQDELLLARMQQHRQEAYQACVALLVEHRISAVLVDVEHLFDGCGMYFYFLGEVPHQVEQLTASLADRYDAEVQFRQFVDTAECGCGPHCGTEEAAGCGSGSCANCAMGSGCGLH